MCVGCAAHVHVEGFACVSRGLRAHSGVYVRTHNVAVGSLPPWPGARQCAPRYARNHSGQAPDNVREQPIPPGTAQNAGYFATSSPFSVFFTEVVCVLGASPPRTVAAPPPIGGNYAMQGCDTPQEGFAWRKTPIVVSPTCAASPTSLGRSTGWREKVRPTAPLQWHFREKVRPARPLRRLFREKVLPARVKTPNLGCCERAGRIFSRFHDLPATQGELFRACRRRPSSALPISDRAPLVWRAPADPESPAAVPAGDGGVLP